MTARTQDPTGRRAVRRSARPLRSLGLAHRRVAAMSAGVVAKTPAAPLPVETPEVAEAPDIEDVPEIDRPWVTVVWNDPINLMSYVTWVFQKLFGYSKDKAEQLMLDVHHKGRAVVSSGARERMEFDASRLHEHGLWATVTRE